MDRRRFLAGSAFALVGVGAPDVTWTTKEQQRIAKDEADVAGLKLAVAALQAAVFPVPSPPGPPTPPTAPASPVIIAGSSGSTTATLTWSTPANGGSAITGYHLYRNGASLASLGVVNIYNDSGLTNGTAYNYQVAAVNVIGEGPKSQSITLTPHATPSGTVKTFPGSGANTQAAFLALLADMSYDILEWQAGTYPGWQIGDSPIFTLDRTARPLLVRPAAGAAVNIDGTGSPAGAGWLYAGDWHVGGSTKTAHITFDPAGTGGSFTFQNWVIGQHGLIQTEWTEDCTFNGFRVRNVSGNPGGQTSYCVYMATDTVHRGRNITFNNWDVVGPADKSFSGLQVYSSNPNLPSGITSTGWTISSVHAAIVAVGDAQGIDIESWTGSNCDYPVISSNGAQGVLKNNTFTGSAHAAQLGALVDGGGNTF